MEKAEAPKDKGFCEHRNFPKSCTKCNAKTVLGVIREDLSDIVQKQRNKQNVRYEKDGKRAIAKYVTHDKADLKAIADGKRLDNIAGLERETHLLRKLEDTGLTPHVIDYKKGTYILSYPTRLHSPVSKLPVVS